MVERDNSNHKRSTGRTDFPEIDGSSITQIRETLQAWADKAFILGGATIHTIPSLHKVVAEIVWIDPKEEGSCFPTGKDDDDEPKPVWALTNRSLKRLSRAAGITWDSRQSGREDDGSNPDIIRYRKTCRIRDLDGSGRIITEPYVLDLKSREAEVYEAKLRSWWWERGAGAHESVDRRAAAAAKKGRPWSADFIQRLKSEKPVHPESDREPWASEQARLDMIQIRKFSEQRAATGAESRCILTALALRRGGYYLHDLAQKPFVLLKLVADIDYANDPTARLMLTAAHTGLADLAYGAGIPLFGTGSLIGALPDRQIEAPTQTLRLPAAAEVEETAPGDDDHSSEDAIDPDEISFQDPEPTRQPDPKPAPEAPAAQPTKVDLDKLPTVAAYGQLDRATRESILMQIQEAAPQMPRLNVTKASDDGLQKTYDLYRKYIERDRGAK